MIRNYKRRWDATLPTEESLQSALHAFFILSFTIRVVASEFGLKKSTLADNVKKTRVNGGVIPDVVKSWHLHRQVIVGALE